MQKICTECGEPFDGTAQAITCPGYCRDARKLRVSNERYARRDRDSSKYGGAHVQERKKWMPEVASGTIPCAHPDCGELISGGDPGDRNWTGSWHLGHRFDKQGNALESLPMHRSCNCRTAVSDKERHSGRIDSSGPPVTSTAPKNSRLWG